MEPKNYIDDLLSIGGGSKNLAFIVSFRQTCVT